MGNIEQQHKQSQPTLNRSNSTNSNPTNNNNKQSQQQYSSSSSSVSTSQQITHNFVLQLRDRDIILDYHNKIKLTIGDIISFPAGGYQGLHLWDSNIILARYVLQNKQRFQNKAVIQLLSGTGIAAIAVKKFTHAVKVAAIDKNQPVVHNIRKNCQKNQINNNAANNQGIVVACIPWQQHKYYKSKFDYVIGADLLFKGSQIDMLLITLDRLLRIRGKALIIVPHKNSTNEDSSAEFLQKLDHQIFSLKKQKLIDEIYMESPLLNQVQGYEQYKDISDGYFYLYTLEKIKQKNLGITISDNNHNNYQYNQIPNLNKTMRKVSEGQTQKKSDHQKQAIKIRQQYFENNTQQKDKQKEQHLKKQLEVVTISKDQDRPEYQRNKRKSITELIAQSQQNKNKVANNSSVKSNQAMQNDQIEIVKKQHELYEQPAKKQDGDKNQTHSNKEQLDYASVEETENKRMRKKSNPN